MSLLDNLPHRCRIQRRVRTADSLGGGKESRTVEQEDVACWEQQASASEILAFEKKGMNIDRKIFFVSNPGVTERHEIVITSRNGTAVASDDEIVLEVTSIVLPDSSAGLGLLWKVMANQATGETS